MAAIFWKLVVTSLQAQGDAREVVVSAENWLSALRLARKQLGEKGGVPPGASCVMGPTGEVTIVDIMSRRRFALSRSTEAAMTAAPAIDEHSRAIKPLPPQTAFAPAPPTRIEAPASAQAKPRATTMAYSPEESAAIRAQLVAAAQPAKPGTSGPARLAPAPAAPPAAMMPAPAPFPQPATRIQAPAAMPAAAQAAPAQRPLLTPLASAAAMPGAPPAPATWRSATVAYMPNPTGSATGSATLVALSERDEEPSAASPLRYRERGYFSPSITDAASAEGALLSELSNLRAKLNPAQRGVFISLALFDYYFQGKPTRGPVATLQWKDWRGEPVFAWNTAKAAAAFPTAAGEPVRTSFVPDASAAAPAVPAAPPVVVVGRAPTASAPTPMRKASDSWPAAPGGREATGEQDRRLAIAFEAVQDLYFLASAAEGMDFAVKLLSELVPSQAVTGCIYDINTDELRFVALTGPGAEERRADAIPSAAGLIGTAAHSGQESMLIADVMNEPRFDPAADGRVGLDSRNMLLLSLHKEDNMLGVIQLINRVKRGPFSEADASVCAYVTGQLAEFLQSKRLSALRR